MTRYRYSVHLSSVMMIPPTSPNRIMWRHRRAFGLLADRGLPVVGPGGLAVDGITQRYTTERSELCSRPTGGGTSAAAENTTAGPTLRLRAGQERGLKRKPAPTNGNLKVKGRAGIRARGRRMRASREGGHRPSPTGRRTSTARKSAATWRSKAATIRLTAA